jgi:hypothetical protein
MPYLRLKRYGMARFVDGRTQGYRVRLEVEDAQDISPAVFVYQIKPALSEEGEPVADFCNIASPADIAEYPVEQEPPPEKPFFRRTYVELDFRSIDDLNIGVQKMYNDLEQLVESWRYMEELVLVEVREFGSPSSSSSSSSSA